MNKEINQYKSMLDFIALMNTDIPYDFTSIEKNLTITICDTNNTCKNAVEILVNQNELLMDCEGVDLGVKESIFRKNSGTKSISVLGLAYTDDERLQLFLFDLCKMSFDDTGLREILEGDRIRKYLFDCRMDYSALKHEYNCELRSIFDLQLLDILIRVPKETTETHLKYLKNSGLRSNFSNQPHLYTHIHKLNNMTACLEYHLYQAIKTKKKNFNHHKWNNRPLSTVQVNYIIGDFNCLNELCNHFKQSGDLVKFEDKVLEGSERYVSRVKKEPPMEESGFGYFSHCFLPFGVLNTITPPIKMPLKKCVGCRENLSKDNHFGKSGIYCHVCRCVRIELNARGRI